MNATIRNRLNARKRRVEERLDKFNFPDDLGQPMMRAANVQYEISERAVATSNGGIGMIHQMVRQLGLDEAINRHLHLFKVHLPYHESDHVLNFAYNALCGGLCLDDMELLRQDEAYLNALGAARIPDPTTAGDFTRRFTSGKVRALDRAIDETRRKVWAQQPKAFFKEARIDADGTLVGTGGECKEGMDRAYDGTWGYHPIVVTLANTGEVLRLRNRPGNRPSHEGAAELLDESIRLCQEAGFQKIVLRGDTDFSQTRYLDGWHDKGITFIFGMDVDPLKHMLADELPKTAWKRLKRPPKYVVKTKPRRRPKRVKQQVVKDRGYKDIRLQDEWVAEMPYRPSACRRTYRLIIVRKNLLVNDPQQGRLFNDYRYFIYITNEAPEVSPADIVYSANDRCHQENILAQLNALRALYAPVDNLVSNEAYMLMTSLAWTLKAWAALLTPVAPGRWESQHQEQKDKLLRMEFRTFINNFIRIPCQVVRTGRKLVMRLLAYNHWQPVFHRLVHALRYPLRC